MRYYYYNGQDYTGIKIIAWFFACLLSGALIFEMFGDPFTNYTNCRRTQRIELRRRYEADEEIEVELTH